MLKIFVGFIFMFVDFSVGGFDIVADFVGLILIYLGLNEFRDIASFVKAKPITIILLIHSLAMSLLSIFVVQVNTVIYSITTALVIPATLLYVYQLYLIIKGIKELEEKTTLNLCYNKLFPLWKLHFVLQLLSTVLSVATSVASILFINGSHTDVLLNESVTVVSAAISVVSAIFVIALLVVDIFLMINLYKAKAALDTYNPEPEQVTDEPEAL